MMSSTLYGVIATYHAVIAVQLSHEKTDEVVVAQSTWQCTVLFRSTAVVHVVRVAIG